MPRAARNDSESCVNPSHSQQESKVEACLHFLISPAHRGQCHHPQGREGADVVLGVPASGAGGRGAPLVIPSQRPFVLGHVCTESSLSLSLSRARAHRQTGSKAASPSVRALGRLEVEHQPQEPRDADRPEQRERAERQRHQPQVEPARAAVAAAAAAGAQPHPPPGLPGRGRCFRQPIVERRGRRRLRPPVISGGECVIVAPWGAAPLTVAGETRRARHLNHTAVTLTAVAAGRQLLHHHPGWAAARFARPSPGSRSSVSCAARPSPPSSRRAPPSPPAASMCARPC
jgi:hypothetical protein